MNSEKSYDSLPNFTAADCEFLLFQSLSLPEIVCNPTLAFSPTPGIKMCVCVCVFVFVFVMQRDSTSAQPHRHLIHSLLKT